MVYYRFVKRDVDAMNCVESAFSVQKLKEKDIETSAVIWSRNQLWKSFTYVPQTTRA